MQIEELPPKSMALVTCELIWPTKTVAQRATVWRDYVNDANM